MSSEDFQSEVEAVFRQAASRQGGLAKEGRRQETSHGGIAVQGDGNTVHVGIAPAQAATPSQPAPAVINAGARWLGRIAMMFGVFGVLPFAWTLREIHAEAGGGLLAMHAWIHEHDPQLLTRSALGILLLSLMAAGLWRLVTHTPRWHL